MGKKLNTVTPKEILVSPEDAHLVEMQVWTIEHNKKYHQKYAICNVAGKMYRLHRVIMGAAKGQIVDHINGNGLDNRRENLRFVTNQQNAFNSESRRGASKYKGVYFDKKRKLWYAQVRINKRAKYIGHFTKETDAALAYNRAAKELYGEFARLNQC